MGGLRVAFLRSSMARKPKSFRLSGAVDAQQAERQYDRQRDTQEWRRWYKSSRWQKERASFLADPDNQFCLRCLEVGILNAGHLRKDGSPQDNPRRMHLVVHHRIRHRGDPVLFWDRGNWETICPDHHDSDAQADEKAMRTR